MIEKKKGITIRLQEEDANNFALAVTLRRTTMQEVLSEYALRYVQDTKELQEQGLIKLL